MKLKISVVAIIVIVASVLTVSSNWPMLNGNACATEVIPHQEIIKIAAPEQRTFVESCRWFGQVESVNKTRVIAFTSGRIVAIAAMDGGRVAKGDLLFTLGGQLLDSQLEVLRNQLATLRQRIKRAEQMVAVKRAAVEQKFAQRGELALAEDALFRLKAERESVTQQISRDREATHIRAPFAGIFTNRKVSVGQDVQKGDGLAQIISPDHIHIVATLYSQCADAELKTKRAVIELPAGKQASGSITAVMPQRTAAGATTVWIEAPDLASVLRPGQTVAGKVIISAHDKALAVPEAAIVRDDEEQAYLFIKNSSGYNRQPVKTGSAAGGWVEVVSGLKAEDMIVVQGAYELFYRDFNKIYKVVD